MVDDHSEFDLATAPGLLLFILIFSVSFLSKCPAYPWNHPACIVKKRENSTSSDTKVGSRSLQQKPGDAVAFSKIDSDGSSLLFLFLISQKSRNSAAFRRIGKRYELPGCVGLFESFRRSRSGGQKRVRGSLRRCKVSVQIAEK